MDNVNFFTEVLAIPALFNVNTNFESEIEKLNERQTAFKAFQEGELSLGDILDLIQWQEYDLENYASLVEERVKNFVNNGYFSDEVDTMK